MSIFKTPRDFFAFLSVVLGFFIALLDTTIVSITLPAMTKFYHADVSLISWVVSGYNLAFAVCLITASRVADQFGRKKIFLIGVVLFTFTSWLCGQASSVEWLIFFRVLQGLSGALVVPVTLPMAVRLFPAEKSGIVMGLWAAITALAAASGPSLGGIIAEFFQWQWIFFINIPLGILTIIMTAFLIEESYDETASRHLDIAGMLSLMSGTLLVTLGLIEANDYGWTSAYILKLFSLSAISFILFVIVERQSKEPMLPLKMLTIPPFLAGILTLFMIGVGTMDGIFFLSFFLTQIMDMSQLKAGITVSIIPLASILFSILSGYYSDKFGSRWFSVAGLVIFTVALLLFSQLTPQSTMFDIAIRMIICGIGMGISGSTVVIATLRSVATEKTGLASGVGNMTRVLGNVFGAAIVVTLFNNTIEHHARNASQEAIAIVTESTVLKQQAKEAFRSRIEASSLNGERSIPSKEALAEELDNRASAAIADADEFMRPALRKVFDKQKAEALSLYPRVIESFKKHTAFAFSHTFRVSALILSIGILFAFFSDPGKKKKIDMPIDTHFV